MEFLLLRKGKKNLGKPKFFFPVIMAYRYPNDRRQEYTYSGVSDIELRSDLKNILEKVLKTFNEKEKIPLPNLAIFNEENYTIYDTVPFAAYDGRTETIIVNSKVDFYNREEFIITHEMCHHLVNKLKNRNLSGYTYMYNNYLFGMKFDEGFNNFLSEQVCGYVRSEAYVFPTFIAREFANIIGVEANNRLYISSAVSVIRNDFNQKLVEYYPIQNFRINNHKEDFIEMTPFEVLCGNVEYIYNFWNSKSKSTSLKLRKALYSVMEMLNYYAYLTNTTNYSDYRIEQERFFREEFIRR